MKGLRQLTNSLVIFIIGFFKFFIKYTIFFLIIIIPLFHTTGSGKNKKYFEINIAKKGAGQTNICGMDGMHYMMLFQCLYSIDTGTDW